jgi:arylsulfatase
MNHVGSVYGMNEEVFKFVATFKDFPPRSFPPSFNPANIMESTLDSMKQKKAMTEGLDVERIRGGLNKMIEQQIQQRGIK